MTRDLTVEVDRDSVAMGDDTVSHAHTIRVPAGIRLSDVLARAAPEIRSRGWSWVAVVDGHTVAVWSVDHGVQLLVDDLRISAENPPRRIHYRYFLQIDPAWLHARLAEGAPPHLDALGREYRPIAQAHAENEHRRRERELSDRLVSTPTIAVLRTCGATIDLHNDRLLRFDLDAQRWTVQRIDTMVITRHGDDGQGASIRPAGVAERWLVAAVAAQARAAAGLPRFPDHAPHPAPALRPMGDWPPGLPRWTTVGDPVAQLAGQAALDAFLFSAGRSVDEIAAMMLPVAG